MATVASLVAELGLEVDGGQFAAGQAAIASIANALKALAVFKGVQLLEHWLKETAEVADAAKKMGDRFALSAETVQELTYAAKANDTSLEALQGNVKRVDRLLSGFGGGKKGAGAAGALQELGLAAKDFKDLAFDGKLDKLADGMKKLDEHKQLEIAQKLGLGTGTLLLLKGGSDGIRELREEARLLGVVVDNDTAAAFEKWNDEVARVTAAVTGLKNDVVVALLPLLQDLTTKLFAWIKANRELIKQRLEEVLKAIVSIAVSLVKVIGMVYTLFEKITPIIQSVVQAISEMLTSVGAASDVLQAIAVAVGAFFALANAPIILLIALISAVVLVVNSMWRAFQGKDSVLDELLAKFEQTLGESGAGRFVIALKNMFVDLFQWIEQKFEWLQNVGRKIGKFVFETIHGDTQGQVDEANGVDPVARLVGQVFGFDVRSAGIDKVNTPDPTAFGSIDKVTQASGRNARPAGDAAFQAPAFSMAAQARAAYDADTRSPFLDFARSLVPTAQSVGAGVPQVNVAAPQLHVTVQVTGKAEADLPDQITASIAEMFGVVLRDAAIANRTNGGRIP